MSTTIYDKIQVIVRIRPPKTDDKKLTTNVTDNSLQIKDKLYSFDNIFDINTNQSSIFHESVKPLISHFLSGINTTIFAYGQTGAGKTFTMGTDQNNIHFQDNDNGIIPRFLFEIFELQSQSTTDSHKYEFTIQFLELYNEELRDLLVGKHHSSVVRIAESKQGIVLQGVSEKVVHSAIEALFYLNEGNKSRATASTAMNSESSRSHSIFIFHLTQTKINQEIGSIEIIKSKFNFVDLAGSERLQRTKAIGVRAKEGININFGLLALGNVICALSETGQKSKRHIPYRDSKLTRLLEDSLGGNSKCMMIACICPSPDNISETSNTLNYASRVSCIENKVLINQKTVINSEISCNQCQALKNRIKELEEENRALKNPVKKVNSSFENQIEQIIEVQKQLIVDNYEKCNSNFNSFCKLVAMEQDMKLLECLPQNIADVNNNLEIEKEDFYQKIRVLKSQTIHGPVYIHTEKTNLNSFIEKATIETKLNCLKIKKFITDNSKNLQNLEPNKANEFRWKYLLHFICQRYILKDNLHAKLVHFYEEKLSKFYQIFKNYLIFSSPNSSVLQELILQIKKSNTHLDQMPFHFDVGAFDFENLCSILNKLFPINDNIIREIIPHPSHIITEDNNKHILPVTKTNPLPCNSNFRNEEEKVIIKQEDSKKISLLNENLNPLKRKRSIVLKTSGIVEGKRFLKDNGLSVPIIKSPLKKSDFNFYHNNKSIFGLINNQKTIVHTIKPLKPINILANFRARNLLSQWK